MKTQEIPKEKVREFLDNPFPEGSITDPVVRQSINDKIEFIFKAHPIHAIPDAVPERRFSVAVKWDKEFGPDNIKHQMMSVLHAAENLQVRGMKFKGIKRTEIVQGYDREELESCKIPNPEGDICELIFVVADGFETKQEMLPRPVAVR